MNAHVLGLFLDSVDALNQVDMAFFENAFVPVNDRIGLIREVQGGKFGDDRAVRRIGFAVVLVHVVAVRHDRHTHEHRFLFVCEVCGIFHPFGCLGRIVGFQTQYFPVLI